MARAACSLFILCLLLNLHGFSWGHWGRVLGVKQTGIVAGTPRAIRADDFTATLPWIFAQVSTTPAFPVTNPLVGMGQDMRLAPSPIPMKHWTIAFRPQLWGYFLDPDFGMSWNWNFYWLMLFLAAFQISRRLGQTPMTAGLLSAGLVFSPLVQFWSYLPALFLAYGLGMILCVDTIHRDARFFYRCFGALALAWFAVAFALWIYPPWQYPVALTAACAIAASAFAAIRALTPTTYLKSRFPLIVLSGALIVSALYVFFNESIEVLQILLRTDYPGNRVTSGGMGLSSHLFFSNLFYPPKLGTAGSNICEMAGFWFTFPLVILATTFRTLTFSKPGRPIAMGALAALALIATWEVWGFPGLGRMLGSRTVIGYGLAGFLLLCATAPVEFSVRRSRRVVALWIGLYALVLWRLWPLPSGQLPMVLAFGAVTAGASVLILTSLRRFALVALIVSAISTATFNPVARGGYHALLEHSSVLQAVWSVNQKNPGGWITLGDGKFSNLLRAYGLQTLDGAFYYPQFALWERLDPQKKHRVHYNRYKHVSFHHQAKAALNFRNDSPDRLDVVGDFQQEPMRQLPFRYLLAPIEMDLGRGYKAVLELALPSRRLKVWEKLPD